METIREELLTRSTQLCEKRNSPKTQTKLNRIFLLTTRFFMPEYQGRELFACTNMINLNENLLE